MGRVRNAVAKANMRLTVQLAAVLLAGSTLAVQLVGFLRMRLLNAEYYEVYKVQYDAYLAAFMVPDFIFFLLTSGALSVTFIPIFNQRMLSGNKRSAWELSTSIINFLAVLTFIASILIIIFAEQLVRYIVAPAFSEAGRELTVSMMRVMAVTPMLFAISAVLASIQQAVGRFTFFALAPILYNVGIIIGITWFSQGVTIFGWQVFEGGIMGVAFGVVFGAILQLIMSSVGLIGLGFDYRFKVYWKNKGFRQVLRLIPARSVDQGMDYIVGIVETNLASRIGPGTVAAYSQATALHLAPINLVGVAISTAAFPRMTERLAQNRPDLFKKELQDVLRVIVWLAMPIAILMYFSRGYIITFIYSPGDALMAGLLGALTVAILFRSIYFIVARAFYAQQDTKTPLYISIVAIALNIALAIWFTTSLGMGAYGLAYAQSLVSLVEVVILFGVLTTRVPGLLDASLLRALGRITCASIVMGIVTYVSIQLFQLQSSDKSFFTTFPKFLLIVTISGAVYLLMGRLLRLKEVNPILARMQRLLFNSYRSR